MKKKLEADLISIAHRILKLKNKSDVIQLHQETQKLYEKLSVLRFVEENFGTVKPTIGQAEIESKLESAFDYNDKIVIEELPTDEPEAVPAAANEISEIIGNLASKPEVHETPEVALEAESEPAAETSEEELADAESEVDETPEKPETVAETEAVEETNEAEEEETNIPAELNEETAAEIEETPESETETVEAETEAPEITEEKKPTEEFFTPSFELAFDPKTDDAVETAKDPVPQFTFDDLLGKDYVEPVFVKPEDLQSRETQKPAESQFTDTPKTEEKENVISITRPANDDIQVIPIHKSDKPISLNDRLSKGITIGLNDRIAFMKHLFANSSEDYNRVLSQLITFDTYEEAKNFIEDMVKPDYNNWDGKDEYADRFMEIVEKRFS